MTRLISVVVCGACLGGRSSSDPIADAGPAHEIAFEFGTRQPIAPIRVNGGPPVPFLFDTGSSINIVDETVARGAGLPGDGPRAVHVALRAGRLRIAPHLYNTESNIDRALEIRRLSAPSRSRPKPGP